MAQKPKEGLDQILQELNQNMQKGQPEEAAAAPPAEEKAGQAEQAPAPTEEQAHTEKEEAPVQQEPASAKKQPQGAAKRPTRRRGKGREKEARLHVLEEERNFLLKSSQISENNSEAAEEEKREEKEAESGRIEIKSVETVEETASPIADPLKEPIAKPQVKRKRMTKKERMTAILGVIMSFFVIIGVISTVMTIVNFSSNLINSTETKKELERYIFPLVIIDVPEFETPENLDNSQIIAAAIWAFIIDEDNDKSQYPHDDLGGMTVPEADIEPYIRSLFGEELTIRHQTVDGSSFQMLYDEAGKSYIIESTPRFLPYTPQVEQIEKTSDGYVLRVNYVQPDVVWNLDPDNRNQSVDKVMEYTLQFTEGGYWVQSVKLLEVTGVESVSSETTSGYGDLANSQQNVVSDLPPDPGTVSSEAAPSAAESQPQSSEDTGE